MLTKAQYNALCAINNHLTKPDEIFGVRDLAVNPRTLVSLEQKGILSKTSLHYVDSSEQLYTANIKEINIALQSYFSKELPR